MKLPWWLVLFASSCGGLSKGTEHAADARDAADPDAGRGIFDAGSPNTDGAPSAHQNYGRCTNPTPSDHGELRCDEGYSHRVTSETCAAPRAGAPQPCTSDADCPHSTEYCKCLGGSGYCTSFGECRTDADCTPGALCQSLYDGLRYRCQKLDDECFTDADCVALHGESLPRCDQWEVEIPARCKEPEASPPPPLK